MENRPRTPTQDLIEAVNSIIHMMLAMIRAQGLRSLIHLPQLIVATFLLRSFAKRFTALLDAHAAGTLPLPVPAPAPTIGRPLATWLRNWCNTCSRVNFIVFYLG